MRIVNATVIVCSPGRNFVTLKLVTDDGLVGWGDATLNGRELAVASYLRDHVCPLLVGRDASRIEDTWQYLYRGAYWRRGPVTMAAVGAVDVALWDVNAKAAGLPLYRLLGGASRDGIRAYGHAWGRDAAELTDAVHRRVAQGFTAVRIQSAVAGSSGSYGVARDAGARYEPARSGPPHEENWDSAEYLRQTPAVFEAVRAEFGPSLDLLHDVHHRLAPIEAARLAKSLEEYRPFWLEDPVGAEDPRALRVVRQASVVPLATGEVFNSIYDYQTLLAEHLIDFVRSAVSHAGGITSVRRIADLAALTGVRSGFHGPSDISPVGLAAALHLDKAVHNFGIQEYMDRPDVAEEVFPHEYRLEDGFFRLGDAPGLGVELDETRAAQHPYRRAYLPVVRLNDGTVHDW